ncbi:MAG: PilZ domain-containing protein [Methylovulum sp.]|nr:PilZ domain-containing protein [Methylovulum sp.]
MLNFEDDSLFGSPNPGLTNNLRVATRFIREDISAFISDLNLFARGKPIPVQLMDISSKGVLISTSKDLRINKKITLTLRFASGKTFIIKTIIVRRSDTANHEYGIKFDHYHYELGDYLLESQIKLVFK